MHHYLKSKASLVVSPPYHYNGADKDENGACTMQFSLSCNVLQTDGFTFTESDFFALI